MAEILTNFYRYLIGQTWQICVVFAVVACAAGCLRRTSAHWRYLLWLVVLIKCLIPPLVTVPVAVLPDAVSPVFAPVPAAEAPVSAAADRTTEQSWAPGAPARPETAVPAWYRELSGRQWLGLAWLAGVAVFLLIAVARGFLLSRWLRRCARPAERTIDDDLWSLAGCSDTRYIPRVFLVDGIAQPFVWGLPRGNIYLPTHFKSLGLDDHWKEILMHELAHVHRFDAFVNAVQILVQGLFFYHPLVWWANRAIRREREKCCDEIAIAALSAPPKHYSTAIVETLVAEYKVTRSLPSLAVAGPIRNLEERIKTIMTPHRKFHLRPSRAAVATVLVLAAIALPTALVLTVRGERQPNRYPSMKAKAPGPMPSRKEPPAAADVADIPAKDLNAGDDPGKRYFLIGPRSGAKPPATGYKLLVVLAGGDGGIDFHPFIKRILKCALSDDYLLAEPLAVEWRPGQFDRIVWPTKTNRCAGMKFSTEEYVEAVVQDVKKYHKVDSRCVFVLGWSSGGPPCYAMSLTRKKSISGSFVAMSVFQPALLPALENARGHAFFLLQSPQDFIPFAMVEKGAAILKKNGAKVNLQTYEGGHGWHGDIYGNIKTGVQWLEANAVAPPAPVHRPTSRAVRN
jgi:beta-lactamase regulating signal transducer with metallopeptidase domain/predicted esterase